MVVAAIASMYALELYLHWFVIGVDYIDHLPNIAYWLIGFIILFICSMVAAIIITTNLTFAGMIGYIFYEATGKEWVQSILTFLGL